MKTSKSGSFGVGGSNFSLGRSLTICSPASLVEGGEGRKVMSSKGSEQIGPQPCATTGLLWNLLLQTPSSHVSRAEQSQWGPRTLTNGGSVPSLSASDSFSLLWCLKSYFTWLTSIQSYFMEESQSQRLADACVRQISSIPASQLKKKKKALGPEPYRAHKSHWHSNWKWDWGYTERGTPVRVIFSILHLIVKATNLKATMSTALSDPR